MVNDRSAPLLDSKTQTPPTDHPYIRLYQYLHQNQSQSKQQGALAEEAKKTAGDPPLQSKTSILSGCRGRLQEAAAGLISCSSPCPQGGGGATRPEVGGRKGPSAGSKVTLVATIRSREK